MARRSDEAGTRFVVVQFFFAKSNLGAKHLEAQEQIRNMLMNISGRRGTAISRCRLPQSLDGNEWS